MISRILIVEDEPPKAERIRAVVGGMFAHAEIRQAASVREGIELASGWSPDLMLLDMSLPTYSVGASESGGRPQGFGGIEVLRVMQFEELSALVVVVTAYETFQEKGKGIKLDSLRRKLSTEHGALFRGLVHYSSISNLWERELRAVLATLDSGASG